MAGYDTIKLLLTGEECQGVNFMEETPKYLSDLNYNHGYNIKDGREYQRITGYLGNMFVKVYPYGVGVENSLCKYYLGDNIQTLTRRATEEAVEKLGDDLHLPMARAKVKRVDIGANLITKRTPYLYFSSLGDLKWFSRMTQPNGILYKTKGKTREVGLYDKKLQAKDAGEPIPEFLLKNNVLRYECRYLDLTKQERRKIGYDPITAGMLSNENFYICMNDLWRSVYMEIEKIRDVEQIDFDMKTKTDLYNYLMFDYIQQRGGMLAFSQWLNIRQRRGDITRKQKSDLLKTANKAMEYAGHIVKKENAVEELDKLVNDSIKFYR